MLPIYGLLSYFGSMKKLLSILLLWLLWPLHSSAQLKVKSDADTAIGTPTAMTGHKTISEPAISVMSEKDYYKGMYELASGSASSATTVTWSALAALLALIPISIGLQALFTYRLSRADVETIRAEMQTQVYNAQVALLEQLSTIAANQETTLNTRYAALETQLRDAVNRELDTYKKSIYDQFLEYKQTSKNEIISIQSKLNKLYKDFEYASASHMLEKGQAFNGLQSYLKIAEEIINEDVIDTAFFTNGTGFLAKTKELQVSDFIRIEKIMEVLKIKHPFIYPFWKSLVEKLPVYELRDNSLASKTYTRNPPASQE